ncbi:histidine phosphatase family protein [Balneolaceae bacterium YR4-1]|uniref:Histidine phosphatase family protein n=1 Tax=Halalkalibaculum roseum TaxID=2709311 RepID=A0A6M1SKR4_9BACT|nr:phosphoglycerate mutase family protein [Halalkalibaculum roseum]NGP75901.1 histidine phosphatase family protein [Halalkalibaculum roseum]
MKRYFLFNLFLLLFFSTSFITNAHAQELTTFILVRHAEKVDTDDSDPALSEEGISRALRLDAHLRHTELSAIYSTPFLRTRSTVQPVADTHGLPILDYDPFSGDLIEELETSQRGGTILIVGHSNTIPDLVNRLLDSSDMEQLEESEYDKLFIITVSEIGDGTFLELTY